MRTPKQCRDRWFNNLCEEKKEAPFSRDEINRILDLQIQYGNQWSKIAKFLPGRTENHVKNFMYATIRRNVRKFNKGKLDSEKIVFKSFSILGNLEIREILTAEKSVKNSTFLNTFLSRDAIEYLKNQNFQSEENNNMLSFDHELEYDNMISTEISDDLINDAPYKTYPESFEDDIFAVASEHSEGFPEYTPMVDFEFH